MPESPKCGKEWPQGQKFCGECGTRLSKGMSQGEGGNEDILA